MIYNSSKNYVKKKILKYLYKKTCVINERNTDIFIVVNKDHPFYDMKFRVTAFYRAMTLKEDIKQCKEIGKEDTLFKELFQKDHITDLKEHHETHDHIMLCKEDEATHVCGTGICGCVIDLEHVEYLGRITWTEEKIQKEIERYHDKLNLCADKDYGGKMWIQK